MVDQLTAARLKGIGEYYFSQKLREIDELNKAGQNILNLGIGSPDLNPPQAVSVALVQGISDPQYHRYQSYKGIPELRAGFSSWYEKFYQASLRADTEILPLIGSKEGIMHICMAFLNNGDEALIPNPGYPTYTSAVKLAGGQPRAYLLKAENEYLPDLVSLGQEDLSKVKLMWVNYPHMPTGTKGSDTIFEDLLRFCRDRSIILINDNPYSFTLTDQPKSILENRKRKDLVLELNSLSKSHNMAGWRVGVLSGHAELISQVLTFKSNMDSGMFKPVMIAAIEALKQEQSWYDQLNEQYLERKKWAAKILEKLGCSFSKDQVGMFVWARVPPNAKNGVTFSDKLLSENRLFLPPGMIFGSEGDQYIRISLCSKVELLKEALNRL